MRLGLLTRGRIHKRSQVGLSLIRADIDLLSALIGWCMCPLPSHLSLAPEILTDHCTGSIARSRPNFSFVTVRTHGEFFSLNISYYSINQGRHPGYFSHLTHSHPCDVQGIALHVASEKHGYWEIRSYNRPCCLWTVFANF